MDRPLDARTRRAHTLRRALGIGLPLVIFAALAWLLPGWVRPSIDRSRIRTARVDRGPVEATLEASGKLVPETEHVLTSPIDSRVTRVLLAPGARLTRGEPILLLDVGATELEVRKLNDRIALERNREGRERLGLEQTLAALGGQRQIKALEVEANRLELARYRRLQTLGLMSDERLEKAATDARRLEVELGQLDRSMADAERTSELVLEGLALELAILVKERDEAARRLELASAVADRDGVLTWVVASEGSSVRQGDELARIADLSSFRVEASVSDMHSGRVTPGLAARVRVGEEMIPGSVRSVHPTVRDGILTFEVALATNDHPALRHNLRVDVHLVTERKPEALRLPRGAFPSLEGRRVVFVVRGDRALRTPVELGLSSRERYEVVSGLEEGDEVVLSDMTDHLHAEEVLLR